jgi:hypothetical protein
MYDANMCIKQYFLKEQNVTFLIGVHCMIITPTLVMQTLFKMGIMGKIENVLQSFYDYFFHCPKRTQEFVELANMVETKGVH